MKLMINTVVTESTAFHQSGDNRYLPPVKEEITFNMLLNFEVPQSKVEDTKGLTMDEAFIAAGGFGKLITQQYDYIIGKFQAFMLVMYIMAFTSGSYFCYCYDYLVAKPSYLCETNGGPYVSCTASEICSMQDMGQVVNYKIDFSDPNSIENLVGQLDLLCKLLTSRE
jgi:hypothetical protein